MLAVELSIVSRNMSFALVVFRIEFVYLSFFHISVAEAVDLRVIYFPLLALILLLVLVLILVLVLVLALVLVLILI